MRGEEDGDERILRAEFLINSLSSTMCESNYYLSPRREEGRSSQRDAVSLKG
jgi:hypothetical protein